MRFDVHVVVVTGGGRGLGFAIALGFRERGATLVIAEINTERGTIAAEALGGTFQHVDVSDHESVRRAVDAIVETQGRIDVWINNAGVAHKATVVDLEIEGWEADIGVMLSGTFSAPNTLDGSCLNKQRLHDKYLVGQRIVRAEGACWIRFGESRHQYADQSAGVGMGRAWHTS